METSEPVSMRKRIPLDLSCILRRRLENIPPTFADSGEQSFSFLDPDIGTVACNAALVDHISDDTSIRRSRFEKLMLIGCGGGHYCWFGNDEIQH